MSDWIDDLVNQHESEKNENSLLKQKFPESFDKLIRDIEETVGDVKARIPDLSFGGLELKKVSERELHILGPFMNTQERYSSEIFFHEDLNNALVVLPDESQKEYVAFLDKSGNIVLKAGFTELKHGEIARMLIEPLVKLALKGD